MPVTPSSHNNRTYIPDISKQNRPKIPSLISKEGEEAEQFMHHTFG